MFNWIKWTLLLSAIALAFALTSKIVLLGVSKDNTIVTNTKPNIMEVENKEKIPIIEKRSNPNKELLHLTGDRNTLFLLGQVDEIKSERISQDIIDLNGNKSKEPIQLIIDSPGGSVFDGTKIISAIEQSNRPVYTVCYGLCASMAAMIHQYGHKRLMVNRSVLMFHDASGSAQGELTKMISRLMMVHTYVNKMDMYVANRAKMNIKDFVKTKNSELWLDSEDSLNIGFSDQTVSINLKNIKAKTLEQFNDYKKNVKRDVYSIETLTNEYN